MSNQLNVLVVEDSDNDYFLLEKSIIGLNNFSIIKRVNDGLEAINYLQTETNLPNLILMDINMPRMDGHTCLKEIRKNHAWKHIPIIIFSTFNDTNIVMDSYVSCASSHIVKPDTLLEYKLFMEALEKYWSNTAILP